MKKKVLSVLALLVALVAMAIPALAQILDEFSVQGSTDAGGGPTAIVGRLYGPVRFSVTGRFNDRAGVKINTGQVIFEATIRELWNGSVPGAPQVIARQQLPDGRSRLILQVNNAQPAFNGGAVRLRTGGLLFDEDPVWLR